MPGATLAMELGCLPGLCGASESLLYEDFGLHAWAQCEACLNSCEEGEEVPASTVEIKGPGTLFPTWLLSASFLGPVAQTV